MIDVRDLFYRYPATETFSLNGLTLGIDDGTCVAIMGSNGSGKSTLAKCLNGILIPTSGTVTVNGHTTSQEGPAVRRDVGVVFQNPRLQITSLSVERELAFGLQNLGASRDVIHAAVEEGLALSGLKEYRNRHPATLGGGEMQRLALAAVLVTNPSYLVLDEVTSLLSPMSRKEVMEMVLEDRRRRGTTILLITQFPEEALLANRLLVLENGRVRWDGNPEEGQRHMHAGKHPHRTGIPG
jgi:energy-coupling factor transport system ATP-binding protein